MSEVQTCQSALAPDRVCKLNFELCEDLSDSRRFSLLTTNHYQNLCLRLMKKCQLKR